MLAKSGEEEGLHAESRSVCNSAIAASIAASGHEVSCETKRRTRLLVRTTSCYGRRLASSPSATTARAVFSVSTTKSRGRCRQTMGPQTEVARARSTISVRGRPLQKERSWSVALLEAMTRDLVRRGTEGGRAALVSLSTPTSCPCPKISGRGRDLVFRDRHLGSASAVPTARRREAALIRAVLVALRKRLLSLLVYGGGLAAQPGGRPASGNGQAHFYRTKVKTPSRRSGRALESPIFNGRVQIEAALPPVKAGKLGCPIAI